MRRFNGIVPVLVTPIDSSGEVDVNGLENLVKYYNSEEVSGLWVLGTGGEDMGLSFDQRIQIADIVTKHAAPEMKLVVGCSFYSVKESYAFMKETENMNFDSYHAMPYHPKVSSEMILNWYKKLSDKATKPFWAYTSGNWAQNITPKMISNLKGLDAFEGVKYSTSNAVDLQNVSSLNDDDFQVISAVIKTYYYSLCLGLEAATSVEAAYFLKDIRRIEKAYKDNDLFSARRFQNELNEKLGYPSDAAKDNFLRVAELKYMLSKSIKMESFTTEYYRNLSDIEKINLDVYLEHLS